MKVHAGSTTQTDSLKHAILMYGSFATVHEVQQTGKGGQPVIRPGVLATTEGLMAALRTLLPESQRGTGLLPETMLATGVDHMVWWVKPTTRQVWFSCKELGGERSAIVPNPGLVMAVTEGKWYVWAVKGNQRPTPETPLYLAPYFNVWSSGQICVGSTAVPKGKHKQSTTAWEDAFFGSFFSHPNVRAPEKLVKKGSEFKFWQDMLAGKYAKFPEGMLVENRHTLQSAFNQIIQKGS